ncbi:hypothetical protein JNB63_17435 [Microbacterium trichothecenolyticum]|uniref:hypothetical protein n=1 Tax=Microbacterium trichothecenolyticum TaxID=69370 RepID=UPI001C6EEDBE|nr:hypothetical protein [Microbacterium trichothecenolyticum]MBW9121883.1 hypothetical protein [Microbacterium trichothecenolyticum]
MNITAHLPPLMAITAITSTGTVILLLAVAGQLLAGRLRRAVHTLAAIALLTVVGFAAALTFATVAPIGIPPP